jgi:hypothetical protein
MFHFDTAAILDFLIRANSQVHKPSQARSHPADLLASRPAMRCTLQSLVESMEVHE